MSAIISPCEQYRYKLSREVNLLGGKVIAYFGINPSTADASLDDHTVRKWRGFTERNDGRRFVVGNVFAFRSTDVTNLAGVSDPVGPDNILHLNEIIEEADILVPCWGSRGKLPKALRSRLDEFMTMLLSSGKPVMCFGKTASQDPKHPLTLGYDTQLIHWD